MLLDKISSFMPVQLVTIVCVAAIIIVVIIARRSRQSEELKSADQRQKDLAPISQRIASHKQREKEAGHQLAKDYE
jgi:K+-sensing histidine kinase KdpD